MHSTYFASLLISCSGLLFLTACSIETQVSAYPDAQSTADSGAASVDTSVDPADDARSDSAGDADEPRLDTALVAPDTSPYASDPRNCGALGHDCLGGACTNGMCAVDTMRVRAAVGGGFHSFTVRDGSLYIVVGNTTASALRRGPAMPGASDSLLFPVSLQFGRYGKLHVESDAIYGIAGAALERYALTGGAKTVLSDRDRVTSFLVEDGKAYYVANGPTNFGARTVALAGGPSVAFSAGLAAPDAIAGDSGPNLYFAITSSVMYRVPKDGGAATKLSVTGMPTEMDIVPGQFRANKSRLVTMLYKYSSSVTCDSSKWAIYSVPKSGGAAVPLTVESGFGNDNFAIDDEYVYWQTTPCALKEASVLRKRRLDGTGGTIDLAVGPREETMVTLDAQYLYWSDPYEALFRAPK